jgi:hypothetical protein
MVDIKEKKKKNYESGCHWNQWRVLFSCNWGFHLSYWQNVQLNTDLFSNTQRYFQMKELA